MFEQHHLNSNASVVDELLNKAVQSDNEDEKKSLEEQAKRKCGFFADHRRVRVKKIRGVLSAGYIFNKEELIRYKPELTS